MVDRVDKRTRSHIMAKVPSENTRPEYALRKGLFHLGLRYRLHDKRLPGKPDLTFPRYRAAIFVNGCFWHWHGCRGSRLPLDNAEYWTAKIARNQQRDTENYERLLGRGWRVLIVWECALVNERLNDTVIKAKEWLHSDSKFAVI